MWLLKSAHTIPKTIIKLVISISWKELIWVVFIHVGDMSDNGFPLCCNHIPTSHLCRHSAPIRMGTDTSYPEPQQPHLFSLLASKIFLESFSEACHKSLKCYVSFTEVLTHFAISITNHL